MLTVVTGAPCAGKSTYVRKHARPGDIIIDFDQLAQALGSPVTHGHGTHHWKVTIEVRDTAITHAVACHMKGATVWIVDSKPTAAKRAWYTRQRARFVNLGASAAELHRRATEAGRPQSWHGRIDRFLAGPDPQPQARTAW